MHYEIEQADPAPERRRGAGPHTRLEHWRVVVVPDAGGVLRPLWFGTHQQALDYVVRTPGALRIVAVTADGGGRVPTDTVTPC